MLVAPGFSPGMSDVMGFYPSPINDGIGAQNHQGEGQGGVIGRAPTGRWRRNYILLLSTSGPYGARRQGSHHSVQPRNKNCNPEERT